MTQSLRQMVERWEQVAKHAATYNLTLDDWLNDLDLRDLIDRRMSSRSGADPKLKDRVDAADHTFRKATAESKGSLWGAVAGAAHRSATQWWYFRYPSSPGPAMVADLRAAGILP
jgi:hypothetical protein